MAPRIVTPPADLLKMAAEYRWAHPEVTWDQVAAHVGRHRKTFWEWRKTEAWEIAFRNAGADQIESLAPAAVAALLKAWAKGNPANALDVLRSLGFMKGEKVTVRLELEPEDVDREIERLETVWQSRQ